MSTTSSATAISYDSYNNYTTSQRELLEQSHSGSRKATGTDVESGSRKNTITTDITQLPTDTFPIVAVALTAISALVLLAAGASCLITDKCEGGTLPHGASTGFGAAFLITGTLFGCISGCVAYASKNIK